MFMTGKVNDANFAEFRLLQKASGNHMHTSVFMAAIDIATALFFLLVSTTYCMLRNPW